MPDPVAKPIRAAWAPSARKNLLEKEKDITGKEIESE